MRVPAVLLTAAFAGAWATASAASPPLVISGARVEIGDGRVLEKGSVVVVDGKIVAVAETVEIPAGATIVDGTGLTVLPGFIDGYSTNGLNIPDPKSAGTAPNSRDTAPATMWHGNRKGIRSDVSAAKNISLKPPFKDHYAQGITEIVLSPGGGMISGVSTLASLGTAATPVTPQLAVELGFKTGSGGGYPSTLFGTAATLRQTLSDAQEYAKADKPKEDAALAGLKPLVEGKIPAIFSVGAAREIVRSARIADEFNFKFIINGGWEAYRALDVLKSHNASVILTLDLPLEPEVKDPTEPSGTPKAIQQEKHDLWLEKMGNAKALADAGIPFAFTSSDTAKDYLPSIRALITKGLPRVEALKAMTSGAAKIFGVADKLGTVEVGKIANLVLFKGDFASDKSEVDSVIAEGTRVAVKGEKK